jgi:TPR repeat protein
VDIRDPACRGAKDVDKHIIQAAERGDAAAQFNLAIMYANGLLDSRYVSEGSQSEATRWMLAAAEQGLPRAQAGLAEIYAGERDTPQSSVEACAWFLLAAAGLRGAQLEKARSGYERASSRLTPSQIATARHFAQSWKPTQPLRGAIREPQTNSDGGRA